MFFFTLLVFFLLTSCIKKKQPKPVTKRVKQSESGSDPLTGKLTEKTTKTTGFTTQKTIGQTATTELANFSPLPTPRPSDEVIKQVNPLPPITKPVTQQKPKAQPINQPAVNPQPIVPIPEVRPESDVVASQVRSNLGVTNESQLFAGIGQKVEVKEQVKPKEAENKEPVKEKVVEKKAETKKIVSKPRQKKSTVKSKIVLDKTACTEVTQSKPKEMKTNKSTPLKSKDKLTTEGNIHLSVDAEDEDDETLRNVKSLAVDPDQPPTGD
ncbi:hypothetical protein M3Y94_01083900 [Aphelenchoides besseyi]|nr:hypothetical protein M3Y94_01083900 [Aphelenchoides besseyi]KAI6221711.1 hypothetical protein M3Y95_00990900 [Aphelenchoides besseyi]